jgi:glycosyltransferase involved in cell wall biosynthesis
MESDKKVLIYVANVDWFFVSHRLPLAKEALRKKMVVYLFTKNTGSFKNLQDIGINCIDVNFNRSGMNPFIDIFLIFRLAQLFYKIRPDYIHNITLKPSIYSTFAVKIIKIETKIINAISGLGYTFIENRKTIYKIIIKILLKIAFSDKKSNFIFQNPDDQTLFSNYGFTNNNNQIIIKGSGVDELYYKNNITSNINNKVKIVLLARMLKDKGVIEFVNAANLLKDKYISKFEFLLVGNIDYNNPAFISEKELLSFCDNSYIKWLGFQNDVKDIYRNCDIVCLPSYREGLPKSLVEAMAMELPIITTNTTGCRECVEDGYNGFLVPVKDHVELANKIELLGLNSNLRIKMGKMSRIKMLEEMSLNKVINETFKFYN